MPFSSLSHPAARPMCICLSIRKSNISFDLARVQKIFTACIGALFSRPPNCKCTIKRILPFSRVSATGPPSPRDEQGRWSEKR